MPYTPCTDKECQHRYTLDTMASMFQGFHEGWNKGYEAGAQTTAPRTRTYTPCTGTNCQMEITAAVLNGRCEGFDDGYAAAVEHFHAAQSMGFEWAAPTCERCGKGSLSAICYDCSQVTEDNASE